MVEQNIDVEQQNIDVEQQNINVEQQNIDVVVNTTNASKKKRHYYPTKPSNNNYIVNAKTGIKYSIKFNSKESRALYHVIDSTAFYDKEGYIRNRKLNYINEPNHLFYDSPEQYKMHHGSNITTQEIIDWHNKQKELNINIYSSKIDECETVEQIEVK